MKSHREAFVPFMSLCLTTFHDLGPYSDASHDKCFGASFSQALQDYKGHVLVCMALFGFGCVTSVIHLLIFQVLFITVETGDRNKNE